MEAPQTDQGGPPPRRRRWRAWLLGVDLALLAPLAAAAWLALTESGLRALARGAEAASGGRLTVIEPAGALLGQMRARELRLRQTELALTVRELRLDWHPAELLQGRLHLDLLHLAALEVATLPSQAPPQVPRDLKLPLALAVDELVVGRIAVGTLAHGATEAAEAAELGTVTAAIASDGRAHWIERLRWSGPLGVLEVQARLDGAPPFALHAQAHLQGSRADKPYRASAAADGTLEQFSAALQAYGMDLSGHALIDAAPFAPVPFRRIRVDLGEVDPGALREGWPRAALRLEADLRPRLPADAAGRAIPAGEWEIAGPVRVENRRPGPFDRSLLPLRSASGVATWRAQRLSLEQLDLRLAGRGAAAGSAVLDAGVLAATLAVRELDLREFATALKPTRLAGTIRARAGAEAQTLQADLQEPRFGARLDLAHAAGRIEVNAARLQSKGAELDARGAFALGGRREFDLRGRLVHFDPSVYARVPKADLNAEFAALGALAPQAHGELSFELRDSRLDGRPLAGRGRMSLVPDRLESGDVDLDLAGNRLRAEGSFGRPGDRLQVDIDAPQLGALGFGLGGRVRGSGHVGGSLAEPEARLELSAADLVLPGGHRLARLDAQGEMRQGAAGPLALRASAEGYFRPDESEPAVTRASLQAEGTRASHELRAHATLKQAQDEILIEARGGLGESLLWSGSVARFEATGATPVKLVTPAALEVGPQRAALGAAQLRVGQALARLDETRWSPQELVARGSLAGLRSGLTLDAQQRVVVGGDSLQLGAEWDLRLGERANGKARLFREGGDIVLGGEAPASLGLRELELQLNAVEDRLALALAARGERLGEFAGSVTALAARTEEGWRLAPDALLSGSVRGDMPSLEWLGPLLSQNLQTSGSLGAEFSITGTPARPRGQGTIRGENLMLALVDQGLRLEGGSLRIDFTPEVVRLSTLSFASPNRVKPREGRIDVAGLTARPGRLEAGGEIELASRRGQLRFAAERLPILQREDRWLMMSGEGTVDLGEQALGVVGKLRADAGFWEFARAGAPHLSDDVVIRGREPKAGQRLRLALDIGADFGDSFYFRGQGLNSRLVGQVRLRTDGKGPLRATGSIRTRGGTFDAYGQQLGIERGIVNFQGPLENPGLNVVALRKNLPVEAGVEVTGTAQSPKVRLVSDPNVPDAEKLSWIVLGRGQEQAGGGDSALLLAAANAILGGPGGGLPQQLMQGLGIDDISVGQGDVGGGASRLPASTVAGRFSTDSSLSSQIVSVGKRLSSAAYLSYEHSLVDAGQVVKLTYQLTRQVSLIGRAGTDNAVDLFYVFRFK